MFAGHRILARSTSCHKAIDILAFRSRSAFYTTSAIHMQRPGSSGASRTLRHRLSRRQFSICFGRYGRNPQRTTNANANAADAVRPYSTAGGQGQEQKESFRSRLGAALGKTKIEWYPIPVGLGIGFLGLVQFLRAKKAEERRQGRQQAEWADGDIEVVPVPRVRPSGPWHIQIISMLPLKAISRTWGWFNELTLPYYLRVPCFRIYSWIFGVNLDEIEEKDLHAYPNLAAFFYRKLEPNARPLDPDPAAILSPCDGRVSGFGMIVNGEVEQVKGMTYSLDALLGREEITNDLVTVSPTTKPMHHGEVDPADQSQVVAADEEFANLNNISYDLTSLLSGSGEASESTPVPDKSLSSTKSSEMQVKKSLSKGFAWYKPHPRSETALHYIVIYLAPGDYHRFHSPIPWVVEGRRHFAGELYSVSPYLQRNLPGLLTLNERVALLGRWRWGFFSMTPVGATNVGSIKINFDSELRTNNLLADTAAHRAAALAARRGEEYHGFTEATYRNASTMLRGHALQRGEEVGGFQLGSTIVLVFEAPKKNEELGTGWQWTIRKGQRVKVGEALGRVSHHQGAQLLAGTDGRGSARAPTGGRPAGAMRQPSFGGDATVEDDINQIDEVDEAEISDLLDENNMGDADDVDFIERSNAGDAALLGNDNELDDDGQDVVELDAAGEEGGDEDEDEPFYDDEDEYWQSDGPQPHTLTLHFFKRVEIVRLRVFLDFTLDESYTPTKMEFYAGMGGNDLVEFATWQGANPRGWVNINLEGVGGKHEKAPRHKRRTARGTHVPDEADEQTQWRRRINPGEDDAGVNTTERDATIEEQASHPDEFSGDPDRMDISDSSDYDSMTDELDSTTGNVLKAMVLQMRIIENHQNGKDSHVRGFQVFARDDRRGARAGNNDHKAKGIEPNTEGNAGEYGTQARRSNASFFSRYIIPEPEIR
ncbi:phosphatidylserine decarboxylase 1 [Ascosphaera aggregata]|nr:phosphatidylserine decarboxylase 1 [Ascosphaera aggregata]